MNHIPPDLRNMYEERCRQTPYTLERMATLHHVFTKMAMITTTEWMAQHALEVIDELKRIRQGVDNAVV